MLFFLAVAFILYGNTIANRYALDDEFVTYNNSIVTKGFAGLKQIFSSRYTEGANSKFSYGYRPIAKATFAIEHQFFGQNPHVSHFINVVLYALTGFLLFMLLRRFLEKYHIVFAFLITLLWMAHPVHTEVVASLKNREEILSFLGCLLMIHYAVEYFSGQKIKHLLLGLLWFLFAYFSKPDAITFLAVIPLVAWYFTDASWKKILLYTFTLAAVLGILFWLVKHNMPDAERTLGYYENPLFYVKGIFKRLATAFYSLFYYLRLLVFPHPLVYYYGYNMIPVANWGNIIVILSFLFYAGAGVWALINLRRKHILAFAIFFFIITISIFSNIVTPVVGIVAERFLYAASLGFCIVIAYFLLKIFKVPFEQSDARIMKWNTRLVGIVSVLLLVWTVRTVVRNTAWKDQLTLYSNDMKYLQNSAKAHDMLGGSLSIAAAKENDPAKRGQMIQEAIRYYKEALVVYPDFVSAHNNLGSIYANFLGEYETAVPYFRRAVELDSSYTQAIFNLAFCLDKTGKKDEAIRLYEKALAMDPDKFPLGYSNLGQIYYEKGRFDDAIAINKKAMHVFPESDLPYVSIGNLYLQQKDTVKAVEWWEQAVKIYPGNTNLAGGLAQYFSQHGNPQKADQYMQVARSAQRKQ